MRPDEKDPSWWGPGWGLTPVIVGGVLVFVVGILIGAPTVVLRSFPGADAESGKRLGYLSPIKFECQFVETTLAPGAHEHAVVLAPVKERPGNLAARRTAMKAPADAQGEASLRGHLKAQGAEESGSQSYVPPDEKDDRALKEALDLLHGTTTDAAFPPNPKAAVP